LVFSKDGKTLVVGDLVQIKFFDTGTGAEQRGLPSAFMDHVQALAFSPDSRTRSAVESRAPVPQ
jgi:hypothetical protein